MGERCNLCGSTKTKLVIALDKKPEDEIALHKNEKYRREIHKCHACDAWFNIWPDNLDNLYEGDYNEAVYGCKLLKNYEKIMKLPADNSDNRQRCKRIIDYAEKKGVEPENISVLDIGSGLCVFLGVMQEYGCKGYCIDPDPVAIKHAQEHVKVAGSHAGTIDNFKTNKRFDIITYNKVLEHIKNPITTLKQTVPFLREDGFFYLELPDGEHAIENQGPVDQEEFYLGHYTIYSERSFRYLIEQAGLRCLEMRSIKDPSGKYTLYAFVGR